MEVSVEIENKIAKINAIIFYSYMTPEYLSFYPKESKSTRQCVMFLFRIAKFGNLSMTLIMEEWIKANGEFTHNAILLATKK